MGEREMTQSDFQRTKIGEYFVARNEAWAQLSPLVRVEFEHLWTEQRARLNRLQGQVHEGDFSGMQRFLTVDNQLFSAILRKHKGPRTDALRDLAEDTLASLRDQFE